MSEYDVCTACGNVEDHNDTLRVTVNGETSILCYACQAPYERALDGAGDVLTTPVQYPEECFFCFTPVAGAGGYYTDGHNGQEVAMCESCLAAYNVGVAKREAL